MPATIRIEVVTTGGLDSVKQDIEDIGRSAEKSGGGFSALKEVAVGSLRRIGEMATEVAMGGIGKLFEAVKSGISSNAQFEDFNARFTTLLGSAGEAQQRMADLAKFGASTPFDLPGVVDADIVLQGFGLHSEEAAKKFGFSGEQIRTIAGDVASGTGTDFKEMSLLLGKFSAGATGEAIARMMELGVTNREELTKMGLEFSKSGELLSPLPESMNTVLSLMKDKYGGLMAEQSGTFNGMMSNLQDWVSGTLRTLSQPIFEVLKEKLGVVLTFLSDPATIAGITAFAASLSTGVGQVIDGIGAAWTLLQPIVTELMASFQNTSPLDTFTGALAFLTPFIRDVQSAFATVWTTLQTQVWPILQDLGTALFPLVGAAIQVLAGFWTDVLQPALRNVWQILTTVVLPVIAALAGWLKDNLPGAIQAVTGFLVGTLFPALHKVYDFISVNVIPILADVAQWLITNVPVAIQKVSDFWNTVLWPALQKVWDFIANTLIPIIVKIAGEVFTALNEAVQEVSTFWTETLWPALQKVWAFIQNSVIPLLTALANVAIAIVKKEVELLSALWNNVLWPALNKVWQFIQTSVMPILKDLSEKAMAGLKVVTDALATLWTTVFLPAMEKLYNFVNDYLAPKLATLNTNVLQPMKGFFSDIGGAVSDLIKWIEELVEQINAVEIPDWLKGESPPPMAEWFDYIGSAVAGVNAQLPELRMSLAGALPGMGGGTSYSSSSSRSFNYSPTINTSTVDMPMDLALATSLAGV